MVTLRIQELAEAKGMTLEQLSQDSGVSVEKIQKYAAESIEVKEETAAEIKTIATQLDVTVLELVKPLAKQGAFNLKIHEMAQEKGMTLEELSAKAEVHLGIILFYSTQAIAESQLEEPRFESYLSQISQALECCNEDLKVPAELPLTSLRLTEFAQERGVTLQELGQLTDIPNDVMYLMDKHPVNTTRLLEFIKQSSVQEGPVREIICKLDPSNVICKKIKFNATKSN